MSPTWPRVRAATRGGSQSRRAAIETIFWMIDCGSIVQDRHKADPAASPAAD